MSFIFDKKLCYSFIYVYNINGSLKYCMEIIRWEAPPNVMQKDERRFESLFVLEAFPLLCVCLQDGTLDSVTILQDEGHTVGSVLCTAMCGASHWNLHLLIHSGKFISNICILTILHYNLTFKKETPSQWTEWEGVSKHVTQYIL